MWHLLVEKRVIGKTAYLSSIELASMNLMIPAEQSEISMFRG